LNEGEEKREKVARVGIQRKERDEHTNRRYFKIKHYLNIHLIKRAN